MKDTKSIVILIFSLLIGVQQWEHRKALREAQNQITKAQEQTIEAIAIAEDLNDRWKKSILRSHAPIKGTREENGITYYLSRDGEWHVNRVVGEFYLNDKTQTWEEYKP